MYVTSATGLRINDVSRPEAPQRLNRLPLPHGCGAACGCPTASTDDFASYTAAA